MIMLKLAHIRHFLCANNCLQSFTFILLCNPHEEILLSTLLYRSLLSPKRVLEILDATQDVPRHHRLHSRGTLKVPPQLKKSPGSTS